MLKLSSQIPVAESVAAAMRSQWQTQITMGCWPCSQASAAPTWTPSAPPPACGPPPATRASAARAVDLLDLEYLCRAVETLAAAGGWNSARLALLDEALSLAPQLSAPTGRLRNQVLALAARCQAAVANACGAPA